MAEPVAQTAAGGGSLDGEDQNGVDIKEGDAADDHQGGHAGSPIYALDDGTAQNGRAGPVGDLDELPHQGFVPEEMPGQPPEGEEDHRSNPGAEEDVGQVEGFLKMGGGHVPEEHGR